MLRALQLAELGRGKVSPNPMVGCVIVHNDLIIGEGWHQKYGDWHAEVNAINSVVDKSLLSESTAYVTLEPCSHFGKTPPCADLLIKHQLKKVVVCNTDPFDLVNGKGIEKLKKANIAVEIGVLAEKGWELNKRFFTVVEKKRPYIILKWAETNDGFIAGENFEQIKISNDFSHMLSHKWRSQEDAILVGTNTALYDNPKLNVRNWTGRNPIRIVLDKNKRLPQNLHLFDNSVKTIHFVGDETSINENNLIASVVSMLQQQKIQSLIVEGGTQLLQSFIGLGIFDEIRVFRSKKTLGKGILAPTLPRNIRLSQRECLFSDELFYYKP